MKNLCLATILLLSLFGTGCKDSKQELNPVQIKEYYPLETGRFIVYRLDSLLYTNFGTQETVRSYEVKYETDSMIVDNLGRNGYRIFRSIRQSSADEWTPDATFIAVNTGSTLEFTENNMRFIKLKLPIRNNYSWKGNSFIDTYSFDSEVRYLDNWDYIYEHVGEPDVVGPFTLENTLTVNQRDEIIGNPDDPQSYSEKNFGTEKYASGIGMIYRYFLHSEYQPSTTGGQGTYTGYGITLTMIDHN